MQKQKKCSLSLHGNILFLFYDDVKELFTDLQDVIKKEMPLQFKFKNVALFYLFLA